MGFGYAAGCHSLVSAKDNSATRGYGGQVQITADDIYPEPDVDKDRNRAQRRLDQLEAAFDAACKAHAVALKRGLGLYHIERAGGDGVHAPLSGKEWGALKLTSPNCGPNVKALQRFRGNDGYNYALLAVPEANVTYEKLIRSLGELHNAQIGLGLDREPVPLRETIMAIVSDAAACIDASVMACDLRKKLSKRRKFPRR